MSDAPLGIKIISALYALGAIVSFIIGIVVFLLGTASILGLPMLGLIAGWIGVIIGIVAVIFGFGFAIVSYGLWHTEEWAFWAAIILGILTFSSIISVFIVVYLVVERDEFLG